MSKISDKPQYGNGKSAKRHSKRHPPKGPGIDDVPIHKHPLDLTGAQYRVFESFSPALGRRLVIKRSTTDPEVARYRTAAGAPLHYPDDRREALENEALAIQFIRANTTIPVPSIIAAFEDRGDYYLIEEYVENTIQAISVPETHHHVVAEQLAGYIAQLRTLKSSTIRSFAGGLHLPLRLDGVNRVLNHVDYLEDSSKPYVLTHGDLAWHNVLVDKDTYDIVCIIDWEYAGIYPFDVEGEYWKRWGPAFAEPWTRKEDVDDRNTWANRMFQLTRKERCTKPSIATDNGIRDIGVSVYGNENSIDQKIETSLGQRLRALDVQHPSDQPAGSLSLGIAIDMTARSEAGRAFERMADDIATGYMDCS